MMEMSITFNLMGNISMGIQTEICLSELLEPLLPVDLQKEAITASNTSGSPHPISNVMLHGLCKLMYCEVIKKKALRSS
jgi:hypothetical protein